MFALSLKNSRNFHQRYLPAMIFYNNIVNLTIFLVVVHGFLINQYIVLASKF
jgi:hypothetical protein